jgi:uncharacterized protein (DUF2062 family)
MPRRFLKRLSRQRHLVKAHWTMRPFKSFLENPAYWSLHRNNVTRAFALGLFIAFIPLPVHMVVVSLLALLLRVNIPIAFATIWLSNPLTWLPQFIFAHWVGTKLLGAPEHTLAMEMSWAWIEHGLLPVWKPLFLGCFVVGTATALIGYLGLSLLWHVTLVMKYHKRKRESTVKRSAIVEK